MVFYNTQDFEQNEHRREERDVIPQLLLREASADVEIPVHNNTNEDDRRRFAEMNKNQRNDLSR